MPHQCLTLHAEDLGIGLQQILALHAILAGHGADLGCVGNACIGTH